jgi:ABC-type transport system involved in multi-copper enzyme maturation permease subunit
MAASPLITGTSAENAAGSGHAHFGRLVLAEWTKLRSVRSTYWSLIALLVVSPFFAWLFPYLVVHGWSSADPADRLKVVQDPISVIMGVGLYFGQLAIAVLGVMVTTSEYSTGMIRSTLLASPRRTRMLAAKSVVFTLLALVIGEIVAFAAFFIGRQTFKSVLTVSLSDHTELRQVVGVGLYLGMLGLFSMVIGSLLRHTAGAITGVVALILVISQVIQLVPGKTGRYLYTYEPTNAGYALTASTLPDKFLITPWEGYGVFAAWTAGLWVLAAWLLARRDA